MSGELMEVRTEIREPDRESCNLSIGRRQSSVSYYLDSYGRKRAGEQDLRTLDYVERCRVAAV